LKALGFWGVSELIQTEGIMAWKRNDLSEDRFVYFIQCGGPCGPVKIGTAANPYERVVTLQVGNPYEIVLIARCNGGPMLEENLHAEFAPYRLRGEWFQFWPGLIGRIDDLVAEYGGERTAGPTKEDPAAHLRRAARSLEL
jgi:hypothetical protein